MQRSPYIVKPPHIESSRLDVVETPGGGYGGEGGRVRISDDHLLMEILQTWEQWSGLMKEFYRAIWVSQKGMASIIGKAKKLRREGQFPAEEFKEIKLENPEAGGAGPAQHDKHVFGPRSHILARSPPRRQAPGGGSGAPGRGA